MHVSTCHIMAMHPPLYTHKYIPNLIQEISLHSLVLFQFVKQHIHLLLHVQHIPSLTFINLLVTNPPPSIAWTAFPSATYDVANGHSGRVFGGGGCTSDDDAGDEVLGDERCSELGTCERDCFAERAMDRRLLVSGSWGADVGPLDLVVVGLDIDPDEIDEQPLPFWENSPDSLPLVYGSDEEDAAAIGDRSSGVDERVVVSKGVSSAKFTADI